MKIQAEISIYPLRTKSLSEPIDEFCRILHEYDIETKTTSMSTSISGETKDIFKACKAAFEQLSMKYQIVMNMKISNACPSEKTE
jgi:uncharacterized protein YqgV (UPF0045/DUF77 family)